MYLFEEHYVEEYWLEPYGISRYIKEIKSRGEYIENLEPNPHLLLFRFFDKKVIRYNGDNYTSDSTNYSNFIKNYNLEEFDEYKVNDLQYKTIGISSVKHDLVRIKDVILLDDYKKLIKTK